MSKVEHEESGMKFSFDAQNVYFPEKSEPYASVKSEGVSSCDFIVLNPEKNRLLLLEAKSSAPKPENSADYIQKFHSKVLHSLVLLLGIEKRRKYPAAPSPMPPFLSAISWENVSIIPVLLVKNHELNWIPELQDKIRKEMRGSMKAFCMKHPSVINETLAREQGLVH